MVKVVADHGIVPKAVSADGGFLAHADIEKLVLLGMLVWLPPKKTRKKKDGTRRDPTDPEKRDTPPIGHWRANMKTPEAAQASKERMAYAERSNAEMRKNGLAAMPVRGLSSCQSQANLVALALNIRTYTRKGRGSLKAAAA